MRCSDRCLEGEGRHCECSLNATRAVFGAMWHRLAVAVMLAAVALILAAAWALCSGTGA